MLITQSYNLMTYYITCKWCHGTQYVSQRAFGAETGHFSTYFVKFWTALNPLHTGQFTPQICTDLMGVQNPRKKGGNGEIGRKKHCLFHWRFTVSFLPMESFLYYRFIQLNLIEVWQSYNNKKEVWQSYN